MKVTFTYILLEKPFSRTVTIFCDPTSSKIYKKIFTPAISFLCDAHHPVTVHAELEDHYLRGQFFPEDMTSSIFCYTHKLPGCGCVYELSGEITYSSPITGTVCPGLNVPSPARSALVKNLSVTMFHSTDMGPQACLEQRAASALLGLSQSLIPVPTNQNQHNNQQFAGNLLCKITIPPLCQ